MNEEALAHWGLSHQKQTNKQTVNEATKYKHRVQNIESKHNSTLQKEKPRKREQNIKGRK